jgi:hypothetical protein
MWETTKLKYLKQFLHISANFYKFGVYCLEWVKAAEVISVVTSTSSANVGQY